MKKQRFIEIDGCINCDPYNDYRKGIIQLHEAMSSCLILECQRYGYTILNPYIGTHELEYILEHKALTSGKTVSKKMLDSAKELINLRKSHSPDELIK